MQNLRGFTLIDLTITILIIGIIATLLSLNWPSFTVNLTAQAELLADDLRYTQSLSMARGERFRLVKLSSNTYQITNSTGTVVAMPYGKTTATFGRGISFGAITNLPNNLIAFNSKGIPYIDTASPGTLLSATATITLTGGGLNQIVAIYPNTGRVVLQ
jgi:type II secretory pathway pseudopilin PulG